MKKMWRGAHMLLPFHHQLCLYVTYLQLMVLDIDSDRKLTMMVGIPSEHSRGLQRWSMVDSGYIACHMYCQIPYLSDT
jgi:hypothetical protein